MARIECVESADFFIEKDALKIPMHAMHHHASFELYFLAKGEREYFIGDEFFQLTEGDLALIPPNILHRTAGKVATRYLIYFSEQFLHRFFTSELLRPLLERRTLVHRPSPEVREQLYGIFNTLLLEFSKNEREGTPQSEALLAGYLYQILFTLCYTPNSYTPEAYNDLRIKSIIKYINENYNHIDNISDLADHFFISKYHLCRIFNRNFGVPLITYLNTVKVRKACDLIKEGKLNLTEIAIQCGFNSSSYFCKVFKNEKGISPTEYKQRQKKQK